MTSCIIQQAIQLENGTFQVTHYYKCLSNGMIYSTQNVVIQKLIHVIMQPSMGQISAIGV